MQVSTELFVAQFERFLANFKLWIVGKPLRLLVDRQLRVDLGAARIHKLVVHLGEKPCSLSFGITLIAQ